MLAIIRGGVRKQTGRVHAAWVSSLPAGRVREWLTVFEAANKAESPEVAAARRAHLRALSQRSTEWHKERLGFVSGSNFNALLGGDRFKSRGEVWDDMFGLSKRKPSNADIERGVKHEDDGIAAYEAASGFRVVETGIHQHPDPALYMIAVSPDGLVVDDAGKTVGCVEVKCPRPESPYALQASVPPWHVAQVHGHIQCTGLEWCDYVRWTQWRINDAGEREERPEGYAAIVRVVRDDVLWRDSILPALESFWFDHVVLGIRPLD